MDIPFPNLSFLYDLVISASHSLILYNDKIVFISSRADWISLAWNLVTTWKESIQRCSVLRTSIWREVQDVDSRMALQEMQATWLYPGGLMSCSCTHLSVPLGHSWLKFWFNLLCSKIEVNILVSCWIQYDLDCTKLKFVEEMVKAISLHQNKVPTDWYAIPTPTKLFNGPLLTAQLWLLLPSYPLT